MEIAADDLSRAALARARGGYVTPKRLACLRTIADHIHKNLSSPTRRELAKMMSISLSSAVDLVDWLMDNGYLSSRVQRHRNMSLTQKAKELLDRRCPHCSLPL